MSTSLRRMKRDTGTERIHSFRSYPRVTVKRSLSAWLALSAFLTACDKPPMPKAAESPPPATQGPASPAVPTANTTRADFATVMRGGRLYANNCAQCHGPLGQGAPQWQTPGPDGRYPAPPLNGTGHTWHHPMSALKATIRNGTAQMGGSMPAWRGKLSEEDIEAIIAWFQAQWPEEIYAAWKRMDEQAGSRTSSK